MSAESDRFDRYIDLHEADRTYERRESAKEYWQQVRKDAERLLERANRELGFLAIEETL